ncbi:hypothetical protein ACO0LL_15710 [Undibacterium sp. TC4M20W]|jgi:hypothetical protein|uniref:hypothetical protein n=1 Tax=Undibacterium TaxID=401469 RepID=UPI001331C70A|nr:MULTISPECIES: hypothetical protein [unclassified Undibacterium]BBB59429.1 hypothetical protein UNDKW_1156 [Undibacterium sp. KW1]BBB65404.1 hypothetical protein UNDYM_1151 [Undibacterium sp. YM2]
MYLDHPKISATNSETEPDRIERLSRVYGYAMGLADIDGNTVCITKLAKIHDHKGTLMVIWYDAPTQAEKNYFVRAWNSRIGDETEIVEHALMLNEPVSNAE